jgi:predicted RNA-binding protein with EMAP domain
MVMSEYLYTDRNGMPIHEGDIVRSYHSQFSNKAYIIGKAVSRGEIEWGASGVDYLTIEVMSDVQEYNDADGNPQIHKSTINAGTTVHPACVEIKYGGAVIELMAVA